jgi:hypothetical protein
MSRSNILLSNSRRLATDERSRDSVFEHYQLIGAVAVGCAPVFAGSYLRAGDSADLAVDGSVTPVEYVLAPGGSEVLRIYRLRLVLQTATAAELTDFGDLAALTNGLTMEVVDADDAVVVDLLGGEPLKSNLDIVAACSSFEILAATSHAILATFDLPVPVRLDGGTDERLILTVNDDLTGLARARCYADAFDEGSLR